jgi:hypothetical protein
MQSFNRSDLYNLAREQKVTISDKSQPRATFFLTLSQVVAPVAVPESKSPALQRFRFFFTRQAEGANTHYWLHFGYFDTQIEAQRWRNVLARIYPRATVQCSQQAAAPALDRTTATQPALTETQVLKMLGAEAKAARAPQGQSRGLESSLNELRASAWDGLTEDDTTIRSGVRHLQVEVQAKSRARKDSRIRKS